MGGENSRWVTLPLKVKEKNRGSPGIRTPKRILVQGIFQQKWFFGGKRTKKTME